MKDPWTARYRLSQRRLATLCELDQMSDQEVLIFYDYVTGVRPKDRKNQIG